MAASLKKKGSARELAQMEIASFIESPQVKEAVGKILMSKQQFVSAARQWVEVCVEVEQLFLDAEKLEARIKDSAEKHGFRIKKQNLPVQQLLAELQLPNDTASISKMRTIGRANFLRHAQYAKSLPAAKETLYITAQALGAGNKATFNPTTAEQHFKKIISAEDYDTEAPRSVVATILNKVVGKSPRKRGSTHSASDAQLLRRIIALVSLSPEIKLSFPGDLKKRLNASALHLYKSKKMNDKDWNVWSSVSV